MRLHLANTSYHVATLLSFCSQSCRYPLDTAAMEEGSSLAGHLSKIDPSRLMRLAPLSLTQCRKLLNTSWAWLELTNLLFLVLQVEQTFSESLHRLWTLSPSFLLPHGGILHQIYHCHWQVPSEAEINFCSVRSQITFTSLQRWILFSPQLRVQLPSHGSCLLRNTESKLVCTGCSLCSRPSHHTPV